MPTERIRRALRALLCLLAVPALGCQQEAVRRPVVVFAVDGAEWSVVGQLLGEGRLSTFRAIVDRGVAAELETLVPSKSPVVWTTVATGRHPRDHGITDFVIPTPEGDVPVSTSARRVPAVWNMVSASGLRVAVLGWWPTWPAEDVDGVVVSNRILHRKLEERFSPPAFEEQLDRLIEASNGVPSFFPPNPQAKLDHLLFHIGHELAKDDFDLLMVYFRSADVTSHSHWKYFRPEGFPDVTEEERRELGGVVPAAYDAVDRAIGEILAAATPEINLFIVSDHGFASLAPEKVRVHFDLDRVLAHFGFLTYDGGRVDAERSSLVTHGTSRHDPVKRVRFTGAPASAERDRLRRKLEHDLATVTYEDRAPALRVRDPDRRELAQGAELIVEVSQTPPSRRVYAGGEPLEGVITNLVSVSGGHPDHHPGIFIAAGPDVEARATLRPIRVHDITPTLLYALGLPVAEDFAGRAITELFSEEFRRRTPLRSIATWGGKRPAEVRRSAEDEELVDELRALGYID